MNKNMLWPYLVQLGETFNGDFGPGDGGRCIITQEMRFHEPTWREISQQLKDRGCCNAIVIDLCDGMRFETHPEIAPPGAWSKERVAAEIDRLRGMGFKVYPKLNFSTGHDKWMGMYSRMVSTPMYYSFCKDIINEVCEVFSKPDMFHLGLDEEVYSIQTKSPMCIIRSGDLLWHDFFYLFNLVESNGARPWIWADEVWHTPESKKAFIERMSHDVLCSNWYYGNWEHTTDFFYDAMCGYQTLEDYGFEQLPTGSTCNRIVEYCYDNMKLTVEKCSKIIAPERLKGFMMAPWERTFEEKMPRHIESINAMNDAYNFYYNK